MKSQQYFERFLLLESKIKHSEIDKAVAVIISAVKKGSRIFTCGNGGSASTASHYVTDWAKMPWVLNKQKVRAFCLNDNLGMLTAYGNDLSYADTFNEALENYAENGDLLVVVSGSGNSTNIIEVLKRAKEIGVSSIAVTGFDGGKASIHADYSVNFPVNDMQTAEDCHLMFGHIVMKNLCAN